MLNSSSMEISRSLTSWQKGARSIIHRAYSISKAI